MPWSESDVSRHNTKIKGRTKKRAWAEIADKVLDRTGDEGQAIRVANAKAGRAKKAVNYSRTMKRYGPRKSSR